MTAENNMPAPAPNPAADLPRLLADAAELRLLRAAKRQQTLAVLKAELAEARLAHAVLAQQEGPLP
jgi:hypothetical protein